MCVSSFIRNMSEKFVKVALGFQILLYLKSILDAL